MRVSVRCLAASVGALYAGSSFALESIDIGGVVVEPSLVVGAAYLNHSNQAFGSRTSAATGLEVDRSGDRFEGFIIPGLNVTGPQSSYGSFFGGVSAVGAMTRGASDAGGFTRDNPESIDVETAFVGWKSGKLFPGLGEDAITLSGGRQNFMIGNGFLIGDGHADQARDAAAWIGPRTAFHQAFIAQLDAGKVHLDLFDLTANADLDYADYKEDVRLRGANFEWRDSLGTLGATYYHTLDADNDLRDGMDVYALRATGTPIASLPQVGASAEYAWQDGGDVSKKAHAWYAELSYTFTDAPWTPTLSYRRAEFSDDYDPMVYGYGGEWGTWYQGEIIGEYMLYNANEKADRLQLVVKPREDLSLGVQGYRFRLDKKPAGVDSRDYAREFNIYADWAATANLSVSVLYGVASPGDAAEQLFGANDTSQLFETLITWSF